MRSLALCAVISLGILFAQDQPPANPDPLAQPQERSRPFRANISPPTIAFKVQPDYSDEARRASLQGTVLLFIVVDASGRARDFKVLHSLGLGLDEKAVYAVSRWVFNPGKKDGQPVPVQAQVQVNFQVLSDKDRKGPRWYLERAAFHIAPGAQRPLIAKTSAPHVAENAVRASATVTFDIDDLGVPMNIYVDKSSSEDWGQDVTEALAKWRFTPASKDGSPVPATCTMDFVRGL